MRLGNVRVWAAALALALVGLSASGADAQDKGPNTGRISFSGGMDYTTAYFFRGIFQEDDDYILQPYGDLTVRLWDDKGPLNAVGLTVGLWNSLHGGPSGVDGPNADPKVWYESDFYTKLSATVFEDLTAGLLYTAYMSPNDRFGTVQELALTLAYDDARLWGPFALRPSVVLAFELEGQADAGSHRGVYLQAGVSPGFTLFEKRRAPLSVTFPLLVGLSLSDYYEFGTGNDDTFGYFSGGVALGVPLAFIPAAYGSWQARAGVSVVILGDNLQQVNEGDDTAVIGSVGLALTY
jgi:hypothetical protein